MFFFRLRTRVPRLTDKALTLANAVNEWKSARCVRCDRTFHDRELAEAHRRDTGHAVQHLFDTKATLTKYVN